LADEPVREKVKINEDFQRSYTHTRPKPNVPPPTERLNQARNQNTGSTKPDTAKK